MHAAPRNGENGASKAGERLAPERVLDAAALRKHAPPKDLRESFDPSCSARSVVARSAFGRSVANSGLLAAKRAGARRVHGRSERREERARNGGRAIPVEGGCSEVPAVKTKDIAGSAGLAATRAEHADVARADVAAPHTNTASARGASVDWRAVLAGASPREVLARLVNADVFELRARVARALAERCYLLDGDFVYLRCIARIARFATRYRGEPSLDVWLSEQVDAALLDALERADVRGAARTSESVVGSEDVGVEHASAEQLGGEHQGRGGAHAAAERPGAHAALSKASHAVQRTAAPQVAPTFVDLARPLGLDPERMRDVCSAFNRCAPLERAAFFAVVLERGELESVAARLGVAPAECARAARHALERCMERATAGPSLDVGSTLSNGPAAQVRSSAATAVDGSEDEDAGREADESAPGRASRTATGATGTARMGTAGAGAAATGTGATGAGATGAGGTAERRGAARGPAAASASSRTSGHASGQVSGESPTRAEARAPASPRVSERAEPRARSAAAPDSVRSSAETETTGASVLHARGAERRSHARGERGDAR